MNRSEPSSARICNSFLDAMLDRESHRQPTLVYAWITSKARSVVAIALFIGIEPLNESTGSPSCEKWHISQIR